MLAGSLLWIVFGFIYFFSNRYTESEFYIRLKERAFIVAQTYLEKDELNARIYEEIRKKHFQTLPAEKEAILRVDIDNQTIIEGKLSEEFTLPFIKEIFNNDYAQLKLGEYYSSGILYPDNEGDFIVIVSAKNLYGLGKMSNLRNILIISFSLGIFAIYIIGRLYAGKVLNPITSITEKANEIRATNLHLRIDTGNNQDELAELAITFNNMLDRLETSFDSQTNFINNASHELKNPLAVILGETEVALNKDRTTGEYKKALSAIEKEALRLNILVNSLLKLAQAGYEGKEWTGELVRIDEILLSAKEAIDATYPDNNIKFDFSRLPYQSDALVVKGSQSLLRVAFTNIIDNACKFSGNKEVSIAIYGNEKSIEISIKDQGLGIPEKDLKDITEPFYRADNARGYKGFGVGLPLTQKIIKLHGGQMIIQSKVAKGTQVVISLPVAA